MVMHVDMAMVVSLVMTMVMAMVVTPEVEMVAEVVSMVVAVARTAESSPSQTTHQDKDLKYKQSLSSQTFCEFEYPLKEKL